MAPKAACTRTGLLLLALVSGLGDLALAQVVTAGEDRLASFNIRTEPDFQGYEAVLRSFVQRHRWAPPNDFCILGQVARDGTKSAWVLWRQGQRIILWDGEGTDLDGSRRNIDLLHDMVAAEADLHGSTYRVTKQWVALLTERCEHHGVRVHIGGGNE